MRLLGLLCAACALGALVGCSSGEKVVPNPLPATHGGLTTPGPGLTGPGALVSAVSPDLITIPARPQIVGRLDVPITRSWQYIVIHHSDTDSGNERIFDSFHRKIKGWAGIGYHFVIGNGTDSGNGTIEVTFRWEEQMHGAHAGVDEYNQRGIGICLVGNFSRSLPTEQQMASLAFLVTYLQEKCRIPTSNILLHRQIKNTDCPGANFPYYRFLSLLAH